ncbi:MAG: hypothetical protein KF878_33350 [Planctomycetes bacterium]|nr:hypothetical protein [Planctomycetota bacterium]
MHLLRGALLACDDAVADEAAAALIRGAARVEDAAALLPDLLRPASARTQAALDEWVRSLGQTPRGTAARLVAASFRCAWLEPWLLEQSQADRPGRGAVGARLASTKVERSLLDALEGKPAPAAFPHPTEVHAALTDMGTEAAAERLVKLAAADNPPAEVVRTLGVIGDIRHGRRLKRPVETCAESSGAAGVLFDAYARLVGQEAGPALAKRAREEDPLKHLARPALVRLGGQHAREHARRPFEALTGKPDQRLPSHEDVQAFLRAATTQDAELFKRLLITFDHLIPATQRLVLVGMGALGLQEGVLYAEGFVRDGHRERAVGAATLALLGARNTASRLRDVALQGKNPESPNAENALIVAALATLAPDDGREVARRYVPACRKAGDEVTIAVAFALARAEDDEGLRPLTGDPDPRVRAATARGIALAALSRREGIASLPVMDHLRHDLAPEVRAEIAVARGVLGLPGAARDVVAALHGRADLLDAAGRGYGGPTKQGPNLLAVLGNTEDLVSLRHALWVAHAACTPGGNHFRPDLGQGRQRELLREARSKLPK